MAALTHSQHGSLICRLIHKLNSVGIQLCYFLFLSSIGFGVLKALKPRNHLAFTPRNLDMAFMSVSATTVSSMSTVEMEVFSNSQLVVLTILMFLGGEVFVSLVGLHFRNSKLVQKLGRVDDKDEHKMEIGMAMKKLPDGEHDSSSLQRGNVEFVKYGAMRFLEYAVLGYFLVVHLLGIGLVSLYFALVTSAKNVLHNKGLNLFTFTVFTIVSTFTNCGFIPTNENMIVFRKNSGLLWILIPQALMGNTLFPSCLRFCVWIAGKLFKNKEDEVNYLLNRRGEVLFDHWLSGIRSVFLVVTVLWFLMVQLVLFCSLEWNSVGLSGLNSYQKIVGGLFLAVNSRHTGEFTVDLSTLTPAILTLFVVMMYLPPYTTFPTLLPIKENEESAKATEKTKEREWRKILLDSFRMSPVLYLAVFTIFICITERQSMKEDPLNFNVLNIVFEVVSAYANVGLTTGYSCKRRLHPDGSCKDKWYGFSGKWSDEGKMLLMLVMFCGRLKKFNVSGGKAWKLR